MNRTQSTDGMWYTQHRKSSLVRRYIEDKIMPVRCTAVKD